MKIVNKGCVLVIGCLLMLIATIAAIWLLQHDFTAESPAVTAEVVKLPLSIVTEATFTPTIATPLPSLPPTVTRPAATTTSEPTLTPVATAIAQISTVAEAGCAYPENWIAHTVVFGDTLFAFQLGAENAFSVDEILQANCLTDRFIYEGQVLWLPPGAAENAPPSIAIPTPLPADPNAPPPPPGLTRAPRCPCELSIQPGWRLEQIAEVIDSLPVGFYGRDFMAVAGRGANLPARDFLAGAPAGASLEGYMLPGSYTVTNEMTALAFRDMVLDAFGSAVGFLGDAAGLNPYQTVTLASIIIREARAPSEQVMVSSVFHNRLAQGKGLGATVTLQYALGSPGNWWGNVNSLVSTTDSPYNTNMYTGLPPSPIASPNMDALHAAVYPAQTNYIFFTGSCDGSGNAYAETYEQHLANVNC